MTITAQNVLDLFDPADDGQPAQPQASTGSASLPTGYVLDASPANGSSLPTGYVLDEAPKSPPIGIAKTAVDQAVQGATFGFGDEIESALAAPVLSVMNGKPISENYEAAHKYAQDQVHQELQDNPGTSIAANLAGGLGTGVAGAGTKAGSALADFIGSGGRAARIAKGTLAGSASGALYGAGSADEGQRLQGAEQGAASGAAVGGALPAIGSALGAAKTTLGLPPISQALQPLAQKAMDYGIPLSRTQISNSGFGKLLASMANQIPFSGASKFAEAQQNGFNRAVASTIGETADKITPDVINSAYKNIGAKYDALQSGSKIAVDPSHINALADIEDQASQFLTSDHSKIVSNTVSKLLNDIAPDGTIAGEKLGSLRSLINGSLKNTKNDSSPYLAQIRNLTMDMTTGLNPSRQALLQEANSQYKNLRILEPLAAKATATGGDISPALLQSAVARKYNLARGQGGKLGDLANIGQAFLKEKVPDSGTAKRLMVLGGLTEIPSAAVATLTGNPLPLMTPFAAMAGARGFNAVNNSQRSVARAINNSGSGLLNYSQQKLIPSALAGYAGNQGNP